MIEIYPLRLPKRRYSVQKFISWLKEIEMKFPKMKSSSTSDDVLYVPFYLRHFNVWEKIIIASSIFVSSITVSSIPLVVISLSSTQPPEPTLTKIHRGEADLSSVVGERK